MSNTFYIVAAYGLTYIVIAGYALRLYKGRRAVLARTGEGRS
jgi:heme exporter protein D